MRRADRLFQIVTFLQGRRRAVTARQIAQEFGVCERTIYRDMQDLLLSGVPVTGEAGVGYMLDARYHMPPIMFSAEEIDVLLLGISMVESATDEETGAIARSAFAKIRSVIGERGQQALAGSALFAPESEAHVQPSVDFTVFRTAIRSRNLLAISYTDEKKRSTSRQIRPLALAYFAPVWVLLGWCELRQDFRNFRLDRIMELERLNQTFTDEHGKRLVDFLAREGIEDRRS